MIRARFARLAIGTAALALALGTPADAQFGGIVYDPSNYAQNVLTAARSLQQINNQITQIQNQAQSLINQARNLANLPTNMLSSIQQDIDRTRALITQAQQIAYRVQSIDQVFSQRYPSGSLAGSSLGTLVANAQTRWTDALASYQDALRTGATVTGNLDGTREQTSTLITASQGATGALQASQAGNQLLALSTTYAGHGFSAFANLSYVVTSATIINSAEYQFAADELAYIATHDIQLDHEGRYTVSAGAAYDSGAITVHADVQYGYGLRSGFANTGRQPSYVIVNLGVERGFAVGGAGKRLTLRLDVVNLFDHVYRLRDGSGLGISAAQYEQRRGVFLGIVRSF